MSTVNHHTREINFKIVYYGAGLSGKTTCLQYIHRALRPETRGPLVLLPTSHDRTIYFDFLPLRLPKLRGYTTRIHLYTVPGQVHYNSTRQLVLSGADGVAFVVDSQPGRLEANLESFRNLQENMRERQIGPAGVPLVLLYNKRDVPEAIARQELDSKVNLLKVESFETIATAGNGVFESLRAIVRQVLLSYREHALQERGASASAGAEEPIPDPILEPEPVANPPPPVQPLTPTPLPPTKSSAVPAPSSNVALLERDEEDEDGEASPITITSLSAISSAIDQFVGAGGGTRTPTRRLPLSLGQLVSSSGAARAVAALEGKIVETDWLGAVRLAAQACAELPLVFPCAALTGDNPAAMVALLAGMPAHRFLRFEEAARRAAGGGAVTAVDAVFGLFYYCDLALRLEERTAASTTR